MLYAIGYNKTGGLMALLDTYSKDISLGRLYALKDDLDNKRLVIQNIIEDNSYYCGYRIDGDIGIVTRKGGNYGILLGRKIILGCSGDDFLITYERDIKRRTRQELIDEMHKIDKKDLNRYLSNAMLTSKDEIKFTCCRKVPSIAEVEAVPDFAHTMEMPEGYENKLKIAHRLNSKLKMIGQRGLNFRVNKAGQLSQYGYEPTTETILGSSGEFIIRIKIDIESIAEAAYIPSSITNVARGAEIVELVITAKGNRLETIKIIDDTFNDYKAPEIIIRVICDSNNIRSMNKFSNNMRNVSEFDLTKFNMSKVEDMGYAFMNCERLQRIDFGETHPIKYAKGAFCDCRNLSEISGLKVQLGGSEEIIYGCFKLKTPIDDIVCK